MKWSGQAPVCSGLWRKALLPQIVLYREQEVLDCDCDMASVHHLLSQIPQDLPYETLISRAGDLFVQFPSELPLEAAAQPQAEKWVGPRRWLHRGVC